METLPNKFYLWFIMIPDYPHKIFGDRRINYSLLMMTLAMDKTLNS